MASRTTRLCCSSRGNLLLINPAENKLTGVTKKPSPPVVAPLVSYLLPLQSSPWSYSAVHRDFWGLHQDSGAKPSHAESRQAASQSGQQANSEHNAKIISKPSILPAPTPFRLQPCSFVRQSISAGTSINAFLRKNL